MPDIDPQIALGLLLTVVLLTVLGVARSVVDRVLEPSDSRRQLISQIMLYGSVAVFVVVMLLFR